MIKDWPIKRFGNVCNFVRGPFGGSLKKNIFKQEGFAVYEQQHAIYDQFTDVRYFIDEPKFDEMSRFELAPGDLIMSCSGTMGKIAIVPLGIQKGIINQALLKLSPKDNLDPKFLKLWMESRNFQSQIEELSQGAAIKNMASVKILKEISVPIPPLTEQKRIVAILDQAFADIDKARTTAERNLKNARELFDSYLKQVFSQRGEGWTESLLEDVCNFKHGFAFKSEFFTNNPGLNLLTPGNFFEEGGYKDRGEKQKFYDGPFPKEFLLNKGSLLVAMTEQAAGLLGSPALVPHDDIFLHNQRLGLVELTSEFEDRVSMEFLFHLFNTKYFRAKVQETATGLKVRHTSPKKMQAITVSLPNDINKQYSIARKLFELKEQSIELEGIYKRKLFQLVELKKSILQKAFTGELTKSKGTAA